MESAAVSREEFTEYRAASGSARGEARDGMLPGRHWAEVRARRVNGEREAVEIRSHQLGITIQLPPEEWDALVAAIKAGEFDDL